MKQALMIVLLLSCFTAYATVYMRTDSDGSVSYSDVPGSGAQEIIPSTSDTISSVPSSTPPTVPSEITTAPENKSENKSENKPEEKADKKVEKKPYTTFLIEKPKDQETIQNQSVFAVQLKVEPELDATDSIQLVLDDQPYGVASKSTSLELVNVDRGEHRLYGVILDSRNTVLKRSNQITIYVQRVSVLNKPNAFNTPAKKNNSG